MGERLSRLLGLARLGVAQTVDRTIGAESGRVRLGIAGVAIVIATLLVVTGVGVGLGADTTTYGSDVDYWIVPEGGGSSALVDAGGPMLGDSHSTATRLADRDDIEYATPVLIEPIQIDSGDHQEYVLAVGVIGTENAPQVAGLSPRHLSSGDPHFGSGEYDGPWTGELVASRAAAAILDVEERDQVEIVTAGRSGTVVSVDEGTDSVTADVPIVLVQLSELQSMTGAADGDQAEQLLVSSTSPDVRGELKDVYPGTTVETRSGLLAQTTVDEDLSLALALTGFLTAIGIGTLFVCTTLGMEVISNKAELVTMSALGVRTGSQLLVVGVQALATTVLGGIVGVGVGTVGILSVEWLLADAVTVGSVAVFHPIFIPYGIGISVLIGLCSLPYLFILVARLSSTGVTDA